MSLEILLAVFALVLAFLLWLLKPDWLRRLLRLQSPEEPVPYELPGIDMAVLRGDPIVGSSIAGAEARGAKLSFVHRHKLGAHLQKGYVQFRTPDGRPCEFSRPDPPETLALVVKEGAA
jgi:hypothetical protein